MTRSVVETSGMESTSCVTTMVLVEIEVTCPKRQRSVWHQAQLGTVVFTELAARRALKFATRLEEAMHAG